MPPDLLPSNPEKTTTGLQCWNFGYTGLNDVLVLARVCVGLLYTQYVCTTKTRCNVKGDDIHPEVNRDGQCSILILLLNPLFLYRLS